MCKQTEWGASGAGGRRAGEVRGAGGAKGCKPNFRKKNGQHFPFANGKGAKVHFSKNIQKSNQTKIF
jgi:hypothetical protein